MRINIVLPFFKKEPGGGVKVMYQYANQLNKNGHDVVIYHASKTGWTHRPQRCFHYFRVWIEQHLTAQPRRVRPTWFDLDQNVLSFEIPKVADQYIRDADIIFSTWWATSLEVSKLSITKGMRHNLIQGNDVFSTKWPDLVCQSFKTMTNHIVISRYLQPIVHKHSSQLPAIIPNAIDHERFHVTTSIECREPKKIILLYSEEKVKGLEYSIAALKEVVKTNPKVQIIFFCAKNTPPHDLSFPFEFFHNPQHLNQLYNDAAIFISSSIHEGWGLPAMEAMACGCACVCTAIEGHLEFMVHKKNALLVEPKNVNSMRQAIIELLQNDLLRYRIASEASESVKRFNWFNSTQLLEAQFRSFNFNTNIE